MGREAAALRGGLEARVRRELTGTFSDETTRYFVGGGAAIVLGLLLGIFGVKRNP